MYCKICGDDRDLTRVVRFWSPDDGWMAGRMCRSCYADCRTRGPRPDDYAWEKRGELYADQDDAISEMYG